MKILFLIFCTLHSGQNLISQIAVLPEGVDTIWENGTNRRFIKAINKEFNQLIREKADSILLFYPVGIYYLGKPFAIIAWKKVNQSQCLVIYQTGVSSGAINKEISANDSLKNISIGGLYTIMKDSLVRAIDTISPVSHQDFIYCQFYFNKKLTLMVGLEGPVYGRIDKEFLEAFRNRNYKLYW